MVENYVYNTATTDKIYLLKMARQFSFKSSELEHEVLVTNKPRMSITGWLKVDAS